MLLKAVSSLALWAGWASCAAVPAPRSATAGTWAALGNLTVNGVSFPRQEHSVASIGTNIYVLGGIESFDGTTYPTINLTQVFSTTQNTWKTLAPMPAALNHANVAAVNGKIYVLGGLAITETGGPLFWNASGACAVYNPATNCWTVLPEMPAGRAIGSAATLVVDDTIYLPGGLLNTNLTNDEEGTTAMFTSYNTVTGKWTVLPDLPAPRDHAGKGTYGDMIYILAGRLDGHWNVVNTVFGYNIKTNSWSTDFPVMPTGRGGAASATIGSLMFVSGGEGDPNTPTNVWPQVQAYDAVKNTWTNYTDMARPVHGSAAAAVNGKIYIPGGGAIIGGDPVAWVSSFTP